MENKEVATVRTITGELIGGFILYGILFTILYSSIYNLILKRILSESLVITAIIAIILQGLCAFLTWKCSISTTFRKRAIDRNDVPTVMKNLMIFTVILCFISALINFSEVNQKINETINLNSSLQLSENVMKYMYNDEQMAQYQAEKEKVINETKTKLYTYLAILEIGLTVVYLGVVPLQKNSILYHAI